MADVSAPDTWTPNAFNGVLEGNNHTIKYYNNTVSYNTNFGFVTENTDIIRNVNFIVTIKGESGAATTNYGIGGVCGINRGEISNCKVISNLTLTNRKGSMDTSGNCVVDIQQKISQWSIRRYCWV